jgi:heme exporter protein A
MTAPDALLSWSKISKSFGRRTLFTGLSGEMSPGQTVVVTGANGSGKSTFLKIIAGLLASDSGAVTRPWSRDIGYASPSIELYGDLTGSENLKFFAAIAGLKLYDDKDLMATVGLSRAGSKLYSSYSSGMKQRLKLAFATLHSPRVVILDEPTIALDSDGVRIVDELIAHHTANGGCALIASNNQDEAERWADSRIPIGKQAW